MNACPNCGCPINDGTTFCPDCGINLLPPTVDDKAELYCPECAERIPSQSKECPHCGCPITSYEVIECEACGSHFSGSNEICPHCGCPVPHMENVGKSKNQPNDLNTDNTLEPSVYIDDEDETYQGRNKTLVGIAVIVIILIIINLVIWTPNDYLPSFFVKHNDTAEVVIDTIDTVCVDTVENIPIASCKNVTDVKEPIVEEPREPGFYKNQDVFNWMRERSFHDYNSGVTLKVTNSSISADGTNLAQHPRVSILSLHRARVSAGEFRLLVDMSENTVTDETSGDVYYGQ